MRGESCKSTYWIPAFSFALRTSTALLQAVMCAALLLLSLQQSHPATTSESRAALRKRTRKRSSDRLPDALKYAAAIPFHRPESLSFVLASCNARISKRFRKMNLNAAPGVDLQIRFLPVDGVVHLCVL